MSHNTDITIIMYHYVRELEKSRYPSIKGLDYSFFKKQIEFFHNNYHVITMEELLAAKYESYELPEQALLLTFDDAYMDHLTYVLPILSQYKMQGSFFIQGRTCVEDVLLDVNKIHFILASAQPEEILQELYRALDRYRGYEYDYPSNEELFQLYGIGNRFDSKSVIFIKRILQTVLPEQLRGIIVNELFQRYVDVSESVLAKELYLNLEQVSLMKKCGMYIGVHSYNHYWLGNLEEKQMKHDIERSLEVLDPIIHLDHWVMNYPYGSFNDKVIQTVQALGCKAGLTTEVRRANLECDNIFALPRFDTNDFPPKSDRYLEFL